MELSTGKILEENLVQSAFHQKLGDEFPFQQDNHLKHKAISTLATVNVARLQFWLKSDGKSMARLENSCLINNQFDRAWRILKRIMGKCCTIQLWKALRDLSRKTHSCNRFQRCFYKVMTQGHEYLHWLNNSVFNFQYICKHF